jgi:ankyrin repeat protein
LATVPVGSIWSKGTDRKVSRALAAGLLLLCSTVSALAGPAEDRLLQAVRAGDIDGIRAALAAKADVNAQLPDRSTALSWAVDRQNEDAVRLLLAAGARPRALAPDAMEPLSLACELGDAAIVTALLKAGADAREVRHNGTTAFALCAGSTTPDVLTAMRARGAAIEAANVENQTPLMWAATAGNTATVKWLLAHGAKVNALDRTGFTPVFFALRSKDPTTAIALLDAGADINARLADGTSVAEAAIITQEIPFAIQVVNHGADVRWVNKKGRQLIHLAAGSGSAALVETVLQKGGDPNAMAETAPAPVQVAVATPAAPPSVGGDNAVNAGIAIRRVVPPQPLPAPATPLQFAARAGSVETMQVLVAAGARPDIKGPDGMTVSMAAAGSGSVAAMAYAYQLDPHLDAIALGGRSIMHVAVAARGTPDPIGVIQFLVDNGAPLAVLDDRHDTPGDALNRGGDPVIREFFMKLLRDRGIVSANH